MMDPKTLDGGTLEFQLPFPVEPRVDDLPPYLLVSGVATLEWDGQSIQCHPKSESEQSFELPESTFPFLRLAPQQDNVFLLLIPRVYHEEISREGAIPRVDSCNFDRGRLTPLQSIFPELDARDEWTARMVRKYPEVEP